MFSSCKSKSKKRKVKPNIEYGRLETGQSQVVRKKLENIEHYQPLSPRDMKEKIRDLTENKRLKDWFDDEEGAQADKMSVTLQVSTPPRTYTTVSNAVGEREEDYGSTVCLRRKFEQFCVWGVNCSVSLKVNNTILKWDETELVEPHLEDLSGHDYNPAGAVCSRPETKELFFGKSSKLNKLLEVIATYNERYSFHPSRRNSKTFVYEALKALGFECPRTLWLFEDYSERIKSLRSQSVPEAFDSPMDLSHYIKHNLHLVMANPLDVEYLYFSCVLSHVTSKQTSVTTRRESTEVEFCLQDLDSALCEAQRDLIFNQFWDQLSTFQLR